MFDELYPAERDASLAQSVQRPPEPERAPGTFQGFGGALVDTLPYAGYTSASAWSAILDAYGKAAAFRDAPLVAAVNGQPAPDMRKVQRETIEQMGNSPVARGFREKAKDYAPDPRDMSTPKFWGAAFAQGGGVGIFGDFLYTGMGGQNRAGMPNWMNLFGPVVGSGFEAVDLTAGNIGQLVRGEDTHAGAEAVRFARSHMPFVNLWYAKSALDHAGLQDLQEMLSPGYLTRMRDRAHKDWGQDFWWTPGELAPDRAPDLNAAVGQ